MTESIKYNKNKILITDKVKQDTNTDLLTVEKLKCMGKKESKDVFSARRAITTLSGTLFYSII